jgi:DNA-binding MarR family transcriptional regulator
MGAKKIAELLGVTPAAISQHLKILRHAGLVRNERNGYWIPYSIDEQALEHCGQLLNEICTCGRKGTGRFMEPELKNADLESLKNYKRDLENELNLVTQRLQETESKER